MAGRSSCVISTFLPLVPVITLVPGRPYNLYNTKSILSSPS